MRINLRLWLGVLLPHPFFGQLGQEFLSFLSYHCKHARQNYWHKLKRPVLTCHDVLWLRTTFKTKNLSKKSQTKFKRSVFTFSRPVRTFHSWEFPDSQSACKLWVNSWQTSRTWSTARVCGTARLANISSNFRYSCCRCCDSFRLELLK